MQLRGPRWGQRGSGGSGMRLALTMGSEVNQNARVRIPAPTRRALFLSFVLLPWELRAGQNPRDCRDDYIVDIAQHAVSAAYSSSLSLLLWLPGTGEQMGEEDWG